MMDHISCAKYLLSMGIISNDAYNYHLNEPQGNYLFRLSKPFDIPNSQAHFCFYVLYGIKEIYTKRVMISMSNKIESMRSNKLSEKTIETIKMIKEMDQSKLLNTDDQISMF